MRTWSAIQVAEGVLGGTILATQKLVDAGIAVSRCFRGLGSDWDTTLEDGLNEYEAENDGLEPAMPSRQSLLIAYADARTPDVKQQALDDLRRYYPNFAGAAASLADGSGTSTPVEPSVREDKRQDVSASRLASEPAGPQPSTASVVPPQQMPDADGDASPKHPSPSASPLEPTPASFDSIKNIIAVELWGKTINADADAIGRMAAAAVVSTFDVTWKPERESTWSALGEGGPW